MVELYIDKIPENRLLTRINSKCLYGRILSARKMPNKKPVILFGHIFLPVHLHLLNIKGNKRGVSNNSKRWGLQSHGVRLLKQRVWIRHGTYLKLTTKINYFKMKRGKTMQG
jgi:hypothetical protein